jgi:hypothetical protein
MSLSKSKFLKTKSEVKANPWHEATISELLLADLLTPFIAPNHKITKIIFGEASEGKISLTYATTYAIEKEKSS